MKDLIDTIISKRNNRVPQVEARILDLEQLCEQLGKYQLLRSQIVNKDGSLIESSPFAAQLKKHPDMISTIFFADALNLESEIRNQINRLQQLKKRFARKSLSIQVFGMAGGGKSTFIQSVSGLDDEVVMTSSGDHCTGVSSYIYNADTFRAEIHFYTKSEIVSIFNQTLSQILQSKGKEVAAISNFSQIGSFIASNYGLSEDDPDIRPLLIYVEHADEIQKLIEKNAGDDCLCITDKSLVKQYVAQHDGTLSSDPNHQAYYKYLAVKFVNIYHPFRSADAGNIVLMDTVGLGDAFNDIAVEQNMYQAIADNSDAVVLLYSPKPHGGYRGDEKALCKQLNQLLYVNTETHQPRIEPSCLFFLLNERNTPSFDNQVDCSEMTAKFKTEYRRKETILTADLHDTAKANQQALIPMLEQLTANLAKIDAKIAADVAENGLTLYGEYSSFMQKVSSVLISLPASSFDKEFDRLFRDLFDRDLKNAMNELMEKVKSNRMNPSTELEAQLAKLSNNDSVSSYMDEIYPIIKDGVTYNESFPVIYLKAAVAMRHAIPNRFRNVDVSLTEQIEERKSEVYRLLAHVGRLDHLIKKEDDMTDAQWMQRFMDVVINEGECPAFHKCLQNLMDFHISVDGFLLYRIIKHMDNFDEIRLQANVAKDKIEETAIYHLKLRLREAFTNIQDEIKDFTMTPNESVFYNIEAFYLSLCLLPECRDELYYLYKNYCHQIWRDELEQIQAVSVSFQEWKDMRDALEQYNQQSMFNRVID